MPSLFHYASTMLIFLLFLDHFKLFIVPWTSHMFLLLPWMGYFWYLSDLVFLYLKTVPKSHLLKEISDLKEFPLSLTPVVLYHHTLYILHQYFSWFVYVCVYTFTFIT